MKYFITTAMLVLFSIGAYSQSMAKPNVIGLIEVDAVKKMSTYKDYKFISRQESTVGNSLMYSISLTGNLTVLYAIVFDKNNICYSISEIFPLQFFDKLVKNIDSNPLYKRSNGGLSWEDEINGLIIRVSTTERYSEISYTKK